MENKIIIPQAPYVFKSGKHKDECVESFIFKNSDYLFHVRNREHRTGDALDQHLDFIFEAGHKMPTKIICPFCQQKVVKYFLFDRYLLLPGLTCCDDVECKMQLKKLHPQTELVPFRFSSLGLFKKITIRRKAEIFFKKVYGMPRIITPQIVFSRLREALGEKDYSPISLPRSRFKVKPDATQLNFI
jgi:hypothetical protein